MDKIIYTWKQFEHDALALACMINAHPKHYTGIFGIPRGGCCAAVRMASILRLPLVGRPYSDQTLVVDEIIDEGKTRQRYAKYDFAVLHIKNGVEKVCNIDALAHTFFVRAVAPDWVVYPWER